MQLQQAFHLKGICTQVAVNDADVLIVQTAVLEANQHESVVVVGQDVDHLVLITALTPEDKDILFLKEAQGSVHMNVYSSQNIQHSSILRNINDSILFAHSYSGCDTASSYGQGKIKTASFLNKYDHLQNVVFVFNNPKSTYDEVAASGEQFILALYKSPTTETNLNNHRFLSFTNL